jgi:hypothetical protein
MRNADERNIHIKKIITAVIGGALLTGAMLGCGAASADAYYKNCTAAWNAGVAGALRSRKRRHMRVSNLRVGDGIAIRQTSLTSSETILTWTPAGMVAVD